MPWLLVNQEVTVVFLRSVGERFFSCSFVNIGVRYMVKRSEKSPKKFKETEYGGYHGRTIYYDAKRL